MKPLQLFISLLLLTATFSFKSDNLPIHQLRIYTVPKENREAFHARFKDHAMRIMAKHGFKIVATWESENNNKLEFIYLLEWQNKEVKEESWKQFMADEEWIGIKKKTANITYVEDISDRLLIPTDYTPNRKLIK